MNTFSLHGQVVQFLPEGVVFLPDHGALIVADVHLGKSATFRAKGLPVPEGDTHRDLARLLALLAETGARRLIVAGDLFHAPSGITPEIEREIATFLQRLEIPFHLVCGNHDAKIRRLPCSIDSQAFLQMENIRIIHDPRDASGESLHLAGHWHPMVKIPDGRRTSLRLPCFLLRGTTLVLPSFGSFTGGAVIPLHPDDRIFVPMRNKVVELPRELVR